MKLVKFYKDSLIEKIDKQINEEDKLIQIMKEERNISPSMKLSLGQANQGAKNQGANSGRARNNHLRVSGAKFTRKYG